MGRIVVRVGASVRMCDSPVGGGVAKRFWAMKTSPRRFCSRCAKWRPSAPKHAAMSGLAAAGRKAHQLSIFFFHDFIQPSHPVVRVGCSPVDAAGALSICLPSPPCRVFIESTPSAPRQSAPPSGPPGRGTST